MKLSDRLPAVSFVLLAAFMITMAVRSHNDTTVALVASSILMFAFSYASATHLLGHAATLRFALLAMSMGWFAEQMGATHGWFFGEYDYTDVLGWRLGEVPMVIPLMWFSLCYTGYVLANLVVRHAPVDRSLHWGEIAAMSFLAAMIVTAFDLGADPYFVFTLKAWIMVVKDGWWFGETIQGFFGWVFVSFVIIFTFRALTRGTPPAPVTRFSRRHALQPLALYGGFLVFQLFNSEPMELRTVAVFAMGIPLLSALAGWRQWQVVPAAGTTPAPAGSTAAAGSTTAAAGSTGA